MHTTGKIGVTGHQAREGLDWGWTRTEVAAILQEAASVDQALTCLAVGTDQLFAEEALAIGIALTAVIPFKGYDRCFEGVGLEAYRNLLARSARTIMMERTGTDQEAFLAAGVRVADDSDLLIAVWDGEPAAGLGGTADVVAHAIACGRPVLQLNPFSRTVRRLAG
ncbi:hypothetical protein OVA07_00805 [Novosphingobium sp. SL115]|uniref:hypothetical protein n=1 Tax=Novosphingobium sp. SL115 TaxID=2995150 RepID=UPI0022751D9E|nr:hypothetical protein [Novosphingobium sp. SL115]MCY1669552.1 hypothetical protein [Novosphingobium sp. SL115]